MIINPRDSELVTCIKKWDELLSERQRKLVDLQEKYNTEEQSFKAEFQMMNSELSKMLDLPEDKPVNITAMLLKAIEKNGILS